MLSRRPHTPMDTIPIMPLDTKPLEKLPIQLTHEWRWGIHSNGNRTYIRMATEHILEWQTLKDFVEDTNFGGARLPGIDLIYTFTGSRSPQAKKAEHHDWCSNSTS